MSSRQATSGPVSPEVSDDVPAGGCSDGLSVDSKEPRPGGAFFMSGTRSPSVIERCGVSAIRRLSALPGEGRFFWLKVNFTQGEQGSGSRSPATRRNTTLVGVLRSLASS